MTRFRFAAVILIVGAAGAHDLVARELGPVRGGPTATRRSVDSNASALSAGQGRYGERHWQILFKVENAGAPLEVESVIRRRLEADYIGRTHSGWFCAKPMWRHPPPFLDAPRDDSWSFTHHWSSSFDDVFLRYPQQSIFEIHFALLPVTADGQVKVDVQLHRVRLVPGCTSTEEKRRYGERCKERYRAGNSTGIRLGPVGAGVTDDVWQKIMHVCRYLTQSFMSSDDPRRMCRESR